MSISPVRAPRAVIAPDVLKRFIDIVGATHAITDPTEQGSYLV
jgi:hypothetical protein